MHFADWPVWARPKDEQAGNTVPIADAVQQIKSALAEELARKVDSEMMAIPTSAQTLITQAMIDREGIHRSIVDVPMDDLRLSLDDFVKKYRARKKPGPKPKAKP